MPNKQGHFATERYANGQLFPNFKTGALKPPATFDDGACRVFPRSDVTQGGSSRVG
jgi:hypothetical protein